MLVITQNEKAFEGSDVREGLTAIISLKIPEGILQFEGQTKGKLGTPQAKNAVETIVTQNLQVYLEENKAIATDIINKSLRSKIAREAARKAREDARKGTSKKKEERSLSGKLAPAQSKDKTKKDLMPFTSLMIQPFKKIMEYLEIKSGTFLHQSLSIVYGFVFGVGIGAIAYGLFLINPVAGIIATGAAAVGYGIGYYEMYKVHKNYMAVF